MNDGKAFAGLPGVPTFQEAGVKGLVISQWMGVFVPAGTPAAIADSLNGEIGRAITDPCRRQRFLEAGQEPVDGASAQFAGFVHEEYEKKRAE